MEICNTVNTPSLITPLVASSRTSLKKDVFGQIRTFYSVYITGYLTYYISTKDNGELHRARREPAEDPRA